MRSPIVLGYRAVPAAAKGSRPVLSSRRATRTAKHNESSPESSNGSSSVSGAKVLSCSAATARISSSIVNLADMIRETSQLVFGYYMPRAGFLPAQSRYSVNFAADAAVEGDGPHPRRSQSPQRKTG